MSSPYSFTEEAKEKLQKLKDAESIIIRDSFAPAILSNSNSKLTEAKKNVKIEMDNAKTELDSMMEMLGEHIKGQFADKVKTEMEDTAKKIKEF